MPASTGRSTAAHPMSDAVTPKSADRRGPSAPRYGVSRRARTGRRKRGNALTHTTRPTPAEQDDHDAAQRAHAARPDGTSTRVSSGRRPSRIMRR